MSEEYLKPFVPVWMEQAGLTVRQYRVLGHLWSRGQGKCFPSLEVIATSCGIRRSTVCKILSELENAGLVTRKKRKARGVRFANEYVLAGPLGAPIKGEPVHLEHRLTGTSKAPANRDSWSTGNDSPLNDSSLNELPLFGGGTEPTAESPPSKKNPLHELVDTIWQNTPPMGRERSSRKDLEAAIKKIPTAGRPRLPEILAALEAWKISESWTKDGGQYVAGIHRWINDRKWEFPPAPATPKPTATVNTGRRPSIIEEI